MGDAFSMIQANNLRSCRVDNAFYSCVNEFSNHSAICFEGKHISYQEIANAVDNVAVQLRSEGVVAGDIVAIECGREPMLPVLLLAIIRLDATFHVIAERSPLSYVKTTLQSVPQFHWVYSRNILSEQVFAEHDAKHSALQTEFGDKLLSCVATDFHSQPVSESTELPAEKNAEELPTLYLTATSGSTGSPKLVMGSHLPLQHFVAWYSEQFQFTQQDRFSLLSGIGYDPMLRDILVPLSIGATLYIPSEQHLSSKAGVANWLQEHEINVMHLTPTLAEIVFAPNQCSLPALKLIATGGEALSAQLAKQIVEQANHAQIINCYGATETPQVVVFHQLDTEALRDTQDLASLDSSVIPLGKAAKGTNVVVLNETGKPCATDEVGEICIQSNFLANGYYGASELSDAQFITEANGRYYKTGDAGYFDASGVLHFQGRQDRQVKYRGYRMHLDLIEQEVQKVSGLAHCAVVLKPISEEQALLVCFYVKAPQAQVAESHLRHHLLSELPPYMLPDRFVELDVLPKTQSGKVDRQQLLQHSLESTQSNNQPLNNNAAMGRVMKIWESVLEVPTGQLNPTDNFFEVGGNSLLASRLIASLATEFDKPIAMTELFLYPNVRELSGFLSPQAVQKDTVQRESSAKRANMRSQRLASVRNRRR